MSCTAAAEPDFAVPPRPCGPRARSPYIDTCPARRVCAAHGWQYGLLQMAGERVAPSSATFQHLRAWTTRLADSGGIVIIAESVQPIEPPAEMAARNGNEVRWWVTIGTGVRHGPEVEPRGSGIPRRNPPNETAHGPPGGRGGTILPPHPSPPARSGSRIWSSAWTASAAPAVETSPAQAGAVRPETDSRPHNAVPDRGSRNNPTRRRGRPARRPGVPAPRSGNRVPPMDNPPRPAGPPPAR